MIFGLRPGQLIPVPPSTGDRKFESFLKQKTKLKGESAEKSEARKWPQNPAVTCLSFVTTQLASGK